MKLTLHEVTDIILSVGKNCFYTEEINIKDISIMLTGNNGRYLIYKIEAMSFNINIYVSICKMPNTYDMLIDFVSLNCYNRDFIGVTLMEQMALYEKVLKNVLKSITFNRYEIIDIVSNKNEVATCLM